MIKEIPILFSTPMVKAILEGRKTITRRLIDVPDLKTAPDRFRFIDDSTDRDLTRPAIKFDDRVWYEWQLTNSNWKKGDLLWVRENYRVNSWVPDDAELSFRYEADGAVSPLIVVDTDDTDSEKFNKYWKQSCDDLYKSGYEPDEHDRFHDYDYKALRLRPNIFLPKPAARIWLKVESVRVERLKEISDKDAIAEGIESYSIVEDLIAYKNYSENARKDFLNKSAYGFNNGKETQSAPVASFCTLWIDINGRESWISNPFVWVVNFTVLSTTGKPDLNTL